LPRVQPAPERSGADKYRRAHWSDRASRVEADGGSELCVVHGRCDLITGSDVLYERDESGLVAGFIARRASTVGEMWVIDPDRGNRSAFNRQMAAEVLLMRKDRPNTPASDGVSAYKGRPLVDRRAAAAST